MQFCRVERLFDLLTCPPTGDFSTGGIGSRRDRHLFESIAGKRSVEFSYLEPASRHRQWATLMESFA